MSILSELPNDPNFSAQGANAAIIMPGNEAACWLWWKGAIPSLPGERLGIIGNYSAVGLPPGRDALNDACAHLAAQGCTLAVGPMNGNTWRKYRLVTGGDTTEPPFFLEPTNPTEYPAHWQSAGFTPLAEYRSSLATDLAWTDDRLDRVRARLANVGMTLRPLATTGPQADADLQAVHALSLVSFADNFLYTPLDEAEFLAQYRPLLPLLRPELTCLAFDASGSLVGFHFALPDANEAKRGEPIRTVIIKTLAVAPGRQWAGLGSLLVDHCQQAARQAGFTRAIHALMHDSNSSRNLSVGYAGHPIRTYALYARRLSAPLP